jgi:hypothetical protein
MVRSYYEKETETDILMKLIDTLRSDVEEVKFMLHFCFNIGVSAMDNKLIKSLQFVSLQFATFMLAYSTK